MSKKEKNVEIILLEALEQESPAARAAYLDQACADARTRAELESLLKSHEQAEDFLKASPGDIEVTWDESPLAEAPGTVVGRYKLLEKIGEGGMAVVYMAEQEEPIRRKVALKIIKLGMDTRQVIARFEAERQALAMMDHPNIAKVLDAGATDTGRPYFVMELVTGVAITEYCDENNISTRDRLSLFIQICNAIQHAHQKGIIHRDIKPSNIMITLHDSKPCPKVIDFGIAKAMNQRLTEKTLFTHYAHIIGTPAYMSPEQAEMSDLDVDTRSDIYSLGVLLYELLTGVTPFSEVELRKAGYLEVQRMIREQEPPKPSTKLSTLGGTLTDIAKQRGSTPDLLTKAMRGDLDWIAMKALEKARDRRYDNVSALALDLQRHLDDQPILARAPGALYRFGKFLRRRGLQVAAAIMIVLFSCVTIFTLWLWNHRLQFAKSEASRERDVLTQTENGLVSKKRLGDALAVVSPLLDSRHVGKRANALHERIQTIAGLQVADYAQKIETDPNNANHYFRRAQQYYWLGDMDKMWQDFDRYTSLLNPSKGTDTYDRQLGELESQQSGTGFVFSTPSNLGPPVNTIYGESGANISPDGLTLYFGDGGPWPARPNGYGEGDIWVSRRRRLDERWTEPVNLGSVVNSTRADGGPCLSPDGLSLYFFSMRPGGIGEADLYVSKRAAIDLPWQKPANLGQGVNSSSAEVFPSISKDGLTLHFGSYRSGLGDIYVSTRASTKEPFGPAENLGQPVNTEYSVEGTPWVSPDGLTMVFTSRRHEKWNIYISHRGVVNKQWGEPIDLGLPVNSVGGGQSGASFTADGKRFFFHGDHVNGFGNPDIWEARVLWAREGFPGQAKED